ncbi:MAG TPA: hypothetical protein VFI31_23650 [Pirellulales bacterium]|nr:hypothetical protein [Pirellulales bacterium]
MRRPQFTLRALLLATLVVAAFFTAIRHLREWQARSAIREMDLAFPILKTKARTP